MNRNSTKKRGLKTNHKDALIAGGQKNSRETASPAIGAEVTAAGGKLISEREICFLSVFAGSC